MRRTFSDLQASRIPARLGVCANDTRLYQWANSATDGCITFPRGVAIIERAAICGKPVPIHDFWFQYLPSGAGLRNGWNCWNEANYQGRFPTFTSIKGVNQKLNFICDVPDDVGQQVLALGYDQNGNWIRTQQNGVWADGELIAYAQGTGTLSVNLFSRVTDLQIPVMQGQSWLYSYDTTLLTKILIGHYQAGETRPSYARYFFPSISCAAVAESTCGTVPVNVIAKLEYVPLVNPTDYLLIGNLPAMEEMMVGLMRAEDQTDSVAANGITSAAMALAVGILDSELDHYLGAGRKMGVEVVGSSVGEICPVESFI
jgi:hypothetical protein